MSCIDELNTFETVSMCALSLTFVNLIVIRAVFPKMGFTSLVFQQRAAAFLFVTGIAKFIIGVILLTALYPNDCQNIATLSLSYPYLVLFLGCVWLLRSYVFYKKSLTLQNQGYTTPLVA